MPAPALHSAQKTRAEKGAFVQVFGPGGVLLTLKDWAHTYTHICIYTYIRDRDRDEGSVWAHLSVSVPRGGVGVAVPSSPGPSPAHTETRTAMDPGHRQWKTAGEDRAYNGVRRSRICKATYTSTSLSACSSIHSSISLFIDRRDRVW